MRLPRDISGDALISLLRHFDYHPVRQTGSHVRLTRVFEDHEHHLTIPRHASLRLGTLNNILQDVATHLGIKKEEIIKGK